MQNPRYTGYQVWNRQGTDKDLADPADISLGHKQVQRWNLPDGWVLSRDPAHEALVSEADYIVAQGVGAARGPAPLATVGAGWNPPGPTAGLPTAAATAIPGTLHAQGATAIQIVTRKAS
jgi:recombinase